MADKVLAQKTQLGQTFLNAMWIAGFLALLQLTAIGYAIYKRQGESPRSPATSENLEASSEATNSAPLIPEMTAEDSAPAPENPVYFTPPDNLVETGGDAFPRSPESIPESESIAALGSPPDPKLTKLNRRAPDMSTISDEVGKIENYLFREMLENGRFYRSKGNFAKALGDFHDVENNLPEHPLVLSEIAGTYGEMGELENASQYWTKVTALGPILGGEYYKVAGRVLNGQNPMVPDFNPGQVLKLGKIRENKIPRNQEGEKVVISIPVFGNPDAGAINVKKMNWNALFYDRINDQTIGNSFAKVIDQYPSGPAYDWADGIEELEVVYHMPKLSGEDRQFGGKRDYFGYAIKLYYEGILQDSVVSSDEIKKLLFSRNAPTAPSPKQKEPVSVPGPDSSLFPRK